MKFNACKIAFLKTLYAYRVNIHGWSISLAFLATHLHLHLILIKVDTAWDYPRWNRKTVPNNLRHAIHTYASN